MLIQTVNKIEKNVQIIGALKILEVINKAVEHVCDSHIQQGMRNIVEYSECYIPDFTLGKCSNVPYLAYPLP